MKYYFTADEHFGHGNIIKYCNRPFDSVEKMDNELIKRANSIVNKDDIVVHIGDFTLKGKKDADCYINRLNGHHIFIKGSHDYWDKKLPFIWETKIDGIYVVACHYAMRVWPQSHYESLLFYGHSHGRLEPFKNSWDVGVDNNNYYPVSFEELLKKLNIKNSMENK